MALGPAAPRLELNAEKISYFAKYAIFYDADKLATRMTNTEVALERHRPLHLEASSGKRNILKIRDASPCAPTGVLPLDIYKIRAKHPWFNSPVHHIYCANRPGLSN